MTSVLITGANRGVGLSLARNYLARGDAVIAVVRQPAAAKELSALARDNPKLTVLAADVTEEASLAAAAHALGATAAVDILICNAGIMSNRGGLEGAGNDAADWNKVLTTNVTGVFLTARSFIPFVKRAKAGKIAVMSSMMASSELAAGNALGYRASKAAVANLGANLAVELKAAGIASASTIPAGSPPTWAAPARPSHPMPAPRASSSGSGS